MLIIGSHVGFNKGNQMLESINEALSYNANAFMFYTGAPQNTNRVDLSFSLMEQAHNLLKENNIDINNIIVHAPYIVNLANPKNFDFSTSFLMKEISRCEFLGIKKLVLHPGSHVGNGIEVGLDNIVKSLNHVLKEDTNISICLETMAGKGTELGTSFEQMKCIIDNVESDKLMVCIDTCHMNDYGYDLSNFDKILDDFDRIIGLNKLGCIHINDSKNIRGSKKDRHDNIGFGYIGFDNLINIIYNKRIENIPKILETPYIKSEYGNYPPYKFEIEMIKDKKFNNNLIDDVIKYYER